jgi:tetratricopeptide (TPR) repeat protein
VADVQKQIRDASNLLARGRRAAGLRQFEQLRAEYPKSASVWLESAFALDRLSREEEAIPLYERALQLGLQGTAQRDALVCLGSSLRTVGRSEEAVRYLKQARKQFPSDVVVELFLALGYHDISQVTHALRLAAIACLRECDSRNLAGYGDVLKRKYSSLGKASNGRNGMNGQSRKKANLSVNKQEDLKLEISS